MSDSVGPMMNMLRNSARPASTWLGGTEVSPSALRVMLNTTKILVKLVHSNNNAGATERTVIAIIMTTALLGLPFVPLMSTVTLPPGAVLPGAVGAVGAFGAVGPTGAAGRATTV